VQRVSELATRSISAQRPFRAGEIALLFLPLFTVSLGYGAVLPILPLLMDRLHAPGAGDASALHAGLLTAVYVAAFMIAAPLWGKTSDRRGPRAVLLLGLLGYAAATLWFGFADSLASGYLARFTAGLFAAAVLPATSAAIVRRYRGEQQLRLLAWVNAALVLGFLAGPVLTAWAHEAVMTWQAPQRSAFHAVVVPIGMTSLLALAAMIGVAWGGRERMPHEALSETPGGAKPRPQAMRMLLALSALAALGLGVFEVGLSLQNQQRWRWSLRDLGVLFAICSLVMLTIQLGLFVRLRRMLKPEVLIIGGFVAMAIGFVLLTRVSDFGTAALVVALIALGSALLGPTLSLAMADEAKAGLGAAIGWQNAAGNLGQALGSAAAGLLFSAFSTRSFGIFGAVMFAVAIVGGAIARTRGGLLTVPAASLGVAIQTEPPPSLQRSRTEDRI